MMSIKRTTTVLVTPIVMTSSELSSLLHCAPTQGVVVVTVSAVVVHGVTGSDSGLSHVSSDVLGAVTTATVRDS